MDENKPVVKRFLRSLEEKKTRRLLTCQVLERYRDGTVSVLIDEVPWRLDSKTVEKLKNPLNNGHA